MTWIVMGWVWLIGFSFGFVAALVVREYFRLPDGAVPEIDAHERSAWPVERGR